MPGSIAQQLAASAAKFAKHGLVVVAPVLDDITRVRWQKECRTNADVAVKRVDFDAVNRAKELRRFAAEAKRKHAEAVAVDTVKASPVEEILLDAETFQNHARELAEHILREKPSLTVDQVFEIVKREFVFRGYRKAEAKAKIVAA